MPLWYLSCGCWHLCTANAPSSGSSEAAALSSGPGQGGWLPWLGPLSLVALGMGAQLCSLAARTQVTSAGSERGCFALTSANWEPAWRRAAVPALQARPGLRTALQLLYRFLPLPPAEPPVCAGAAAGPAVCLQCISAAAQLPRHRV